jgi:hypothetical protein
MTKDEAIALSKTEFWTAMSYRERAMFQMFEDKLCMPFDVFHEALEKTLDRPVWTHELAMNYDGIKKELLGERPAPTFEDILNMIPAEKRVIVFAGE